MLVVVYHPYHNEHNENPPSLLRVVVAVVDSGSDRAAAALGPETGGGKVLLAGAELAATRTVIVVRGHDGSLWNK